MSRINWLEIEGVRYELVGDSIHCQTSVGFQSRLPGMFLEDIEISDADGNPLGYLRVDFSSGDLAISPLVSSVELANSRLALEDETGVHSLLLNELKITLDSLLYSLTDDSSDSLNFAMQPPSVDMSIDQSELFTAVISDGDEVLDAFFGESISNTQVHGQPPSVTTDADISLAYSSLYLELASVPPLTHFSPLDTFTYEMIL